MLYSFLCKKKNGSMLQVFVLGVDAKKRAATGWSPLEIYHQ